MSAAGSGHMSSFTSRSALPTFGNFGSTLLERSNPGLRKSTPDSEALASSDEEVEQSRLRSAQRKTINNRRSSLLGDSNHGDSRQFPHHGSHPYSPSTGSQPNTPSVTQDTTWTSISPSVGAWSTASAYPFGPNIWGANSRDPPARLQEVKQDTSAENRFPFPIPSQSNPIVQRSMSFSVGQSDYEPTSTYNSTSSMEYPPRNIPGLTRRSSRPANMGHEFGGLARVNESDGDPEGPQSAITVAPPSMSNIPGRNITRTLSSTSTPTNHSLFRSSRSNLNHPDLDISEVAIEEYDDTADMHYATRESRMAPATRRMTENLIAPIRQPQNPSSLNSGFNNATRTHLTWTTIPTSSNINNGPSRRHSFADVPTRRGTSGSTDDPNLLSLSQLHNHQHLGELTPGVHPEYYFAKNDAAKDRAERGVSQQLLYEQQLMSLGHPIPPQVMPALYPDRVNPNRDDPDQLLYYVVNFKCCRSEVFRIKDGMDLHIQEGDLVMVEADRGEDLGCVMHGPIDKHTANKYKTKYSEQHFGWLMMFTAQAHTGSDNPLNPNAVYAPAAMPGTVTNPGEKDKDDGNRCKTIKRHAVGSELQRLQDKEGLEAKAKRDCQVKVNEHGFNMEILDAEYQHDMRKLTFFFFSTEYINFNVLVTDLFKKFKTRIWMYAINPASFQSPLSSMIIQPIQQNPPPGNVMPGRGSTSVYTSGNRYGSYMTAYQGQPENGFNSAFAAPFTSPYTTYDQQSPMHYNASSYQSGYLQPQAGFAQAPATYTTHPTPYIPQGSTWSARTQPPPIVNPFSGTVTFTDRNGNPTGLTWSNNANNTYTFAAPPNNGTNGQSDTPLNDLTNRLSGMNMRR